MLSSDTLWNVAAVACPKTGWTADWSIYFSYCLFLYFSMDGVWKKKSGAWRCPSSWLSGLALAWWGLGMDLIRIPLVRPHLAIRNKCWLVIEIFPAERSEVVCSKYVLQYAFGATISATIVPLLNATGVGWTFTICRHQIALLTLLRRLIKI